jgi:hypothetical protein
MRDHHSRRRLFEDLEERKLLSVTVPGTLDRPGDPVVLTGAVVPGLVGISPGDLVAFRDTGSGWQQVPVQVDERAMVSMYQIYGQTYSHPNLTILTYTDPGTFVGPDPNALLDTDDEIVFMAKDTGGRVPVGQAAPADVDPASKLEIVVADPLDPQERGWVYLFRRTSGAITPGAGTSYVNYQFSLVAGNYLTDYDVLDGPNPENSTVTTAYYGRKFTDRWITTELKIHAGTGVDLLDRHKFQFAPGVGTRSENTFSNGEGAFIINKSGPVRALRSWVGANSGPYTQREEVYYERREDVRTYLRVHEIPAGMDLFDYTSTASGMIYRNNLNTAGVVVDGSPDTVATGAIEWEQIAGAQGSLSMSHILDTNLPGYSLTSYYLDDTTPPSGEQQVTGDSEAWGQSGPWLINLESTDVGSPYYLTSTRAMYYSGAGGTLADAQHNDSLARNPLQGAVDAPQVSTVVTGRRIFYNNSIWDNPTFGFDNASAIAPDKSAYVPLGSPGTVTVGVANVTNYTKGINGIMVELNGPSAGVTAADFVVKMSGQDLAADNTPSGWAAAPAFTLTVVPNMPAPGATRFELVWPDGAIVDRYVQVTTLANGNTGLSSPDVFYFGNRVGDAFTSYPGFFNTDAADAIEARNNQSPFAGITNPYDFDRDAVVNANDELAARFDQNFMAALVLSNPPAAPEAADGGSAEGSEAAVASALAVNSVLEIDEEPSLALRAGVAAAALEVPSLALRVGMAAELLVDDESARLSVADDDAELAELGLDDELLDALVA